MIRIFALHANAVLWPCRPGVLPRICDDQGWPALSGQPAVPIAGAGFFCRTGIGSRMRERVNLGKSAPALYQAVVELDRLASEAAAQAGIATGFTHLLRLRASQLNQCAFCVRLHARDALASQESGDRIAVLPAWRETDYFSPKERAALERVEAVTLVADGQVPDAVYAQAAGVLSKEEIAAVEWLAVVINAWNRIAISSRYPVRA